MKNGGSDVVGSAVGAVKIKLHPLKIEPRGERAFTKFNVAAGRIIEPSGFAEIVACLTVKAFVDFGFNGKLHGVRKFCAGSGEKLDAVVAVRIVACADRNAGFKSQSPREIGNCGRRNGPGENRIHAGRRKPRLQRGFQHVARHPGVLAD